MDDRLLQDEGEGGRPEDEPEASPHQRFAALQGLNRSNILIADHRDRQRPARIKPRPWDHKQPHCRARERDGDQRGHEDALDEGSRFEQSCKLSLYTSPMMHGDRLDVIMRFASAVSSEEGEMSIYPTKILLATDGSSESELAARTAVDLGQQTNSELHLIHVWDIATTALLYPDATDPEGVELPDPILEEDLERSAEGQGSSRQGIGTSMVGRWDGSTVPSDDGRGSTGDHPPGRGSRGRTGGDGQCL
jgi:hypothetical protein